MSQNESDKVWENVGDVLKKLLKVKDVTKRRQVLAMAWFRLGADISYMISKDLMIEMVELFYDKSEVPDDFDSSDIIIRLIKEARTQND